VEGELVEKCLDEPNKVRYVRFVQEALFLYKSKDLDIPSDIIFLPGMTVANYKSPSSQLGFVIKHRDGFYPERLFLMH
jgi:hypothetical protein